MRTALKGGLASSLRHRQDVPTNLGRVTPAQLRDLLKKPKRNKYGNKFTIVDGIKFHSRREANRWIYLKARNDIRALKRQTRFQITVESKPICVYICDFDYFEGVAHVVEDSKGVETDVFKLKWKLCKALYPNIFWRIV